MVQGADFIKKLSQSALIVLPDKNLLDTRNRFKVCTSARYLEDYIEDDESKCNWLRECKLTW